MLKKAKRFDEMNVIPFIDIMLVLLAIVLTTASFINQGLIPVNLPTADTSEPATNDLKPLFISINIENELFVGEVGSEAAITEAALEQKLSTLSKDQIIVLRVDNQTDFGRFAMLLDWFKKYQLLDVSIQTEQN